MPHSLSRIPTADLVAELEKRPDYCWYRGKEVRITPSDPKSSAPDRVEHYCHNPDEKRTTCEQNGGLHRCMYWIRRENRKANGGE